jgi:hypothetical protein
MHTTETAGVPSYNNGATAPHFTYFCRERSWIQHADLDKRVGTDKSAGNPCSIAVELIAYSDRSIAEDHPDRIWVGELSAGHFDDLAEFGAWLQLGPWPELNLGEWVYGASGDFASYRYGANASTRLSWDEWDAAGGFLLGHGASPSGSTHWDPGAMDLYRLSAEIKRKIGAPPPPPIVSNVLIEFGDAGADVQYWAGIVGFLGGDIEPDHLHYDEDMRAAVEQVLPNTKGMRITGRQGAMLSNRLWRNRD